VKKYLITITLCLLAACADHSEGLPPFELYAGSGGALEPDAAGSSGSMAGAASAAAGSDAAGTAGTGSAGTGSAGTPVVTAGSSGAAGAAGGAAGASGAAGGAAGAAGRAGGGAAGAAGSAGAAGAAGAAAADVSADFCRVKVGPYAGRTFGCGYVPAGFRISWKVDGTAYHCGMRGHSLYPQTCAAGASCSLVILDSTGQPDGGYLGVCF
jgi:hypothetical protein